MFVCEVEWINEDALDDLPRPTTRDEYDALFSSSRIRDGVRMFPCVRIGGEAYLLKYDDNHENDWADHYFKKLSELQAAGALPADFRF